MWKTQIVDGSKFVGDDSNLLPLLSELNPSEKINISTIGNSGGCPPNKNSSMKGKSLLNLSQVNLCKLKICFFKFAVQDCKRLKHFG